jgi:cysteine-rich repeat protein
MASHRQARIAAVLALCAAGSRAAATTADDLCPPAADPCVVRTALSVEPDSIVDVEDRTLEIRSPGVLTVTGGDLVLAARSVLVGSGAKVVGLPDGTSPATIIVIAAGDVLVEPTGRVLVNSDTVPGRLEIYADGAIGVDGALQARGLGASVDGGVVLLEAAGITVHGAVSVEGHGEGWGGLLRARAAGDVVFAGTIDATGANGATLEITSTGGAVRLTGITDLGARPPYGDGGSLEITAAGDVVLGQVKGRGSGSPSDGGGTGATIALASQRDVTFTGPIDIDGAPPDGTGGSLEVEAAGGYTQSAAVGAAGAGADGCGGAIAIAAGADGTTAALSVAGGRCGGGVVEVSAGDELTVGADIDANGTGTTFGGGTATVEAPRVRVVGAIRANGMFGAAGGTVWVTGCEPILEGTSELAAKGSAGRTVIWASGRATVAGDLVAGVSNQIILRDPALPPLFLPGFSARPEVTIGVSPVLDPCLAPGVCGNRAIEAGEECDDGGTAACDGCSAGCRRERCGNGVGECREECDAGPANGSAGSGCSATCTEAAPALRIAGGGAATTDCAFQWALAHAQPARDLTGHVTSRQRCVDGDPGCDFDPTPGICRFKLWPCVGAANVSAGCAASTVTRLELRKPTDRDGPPSGALRPALLAGLAALPVPAGPGETCGPRITLEVPAGKRKASIQVRAHRGGLAADGDGLKLLCGALPDQARGISFSSTTLPSGSFTYSDGPEPRAP